MSFFSGPSPLERRIEAATNENIAEPPLEEYLAIAEDVAKSSDAGAQHLKYIRKRLSSKSAHVQFLALSLLDVCVKNGRDAFHETVAAPEFLQFMSTVATSSKQPYVRDQALSLLQQWAKAFPRQGLHSFTEAYVRLKNRGVPFPDDKDGGVVITPPVNLTVVAQRGQLGQGRHAPDRSPNRSPNRSPGRSPGRSPRRSPTPREEKEDPAASAADEALSYVSPQYVAKVKAESLQVLEYLTLFQQLISSSGPAAEIRSNESIQTLHSTIVDCRQRVSRLLVEIEDETLTDLCIQVHELIRASLDYYTAKSKGQDVPEPAIAVPNVLKTAGTTAGTTVAAGEAKEGKEAKEEKEAKQQAAQGKADKDGEAENDPFAELAHRNDKQQSARTSPPAGGAAGSSAADVSLSQFDPLA